MRRKLFEMAETSSDEDGETNRNTYTVLYCIIVFFIVARTYNHHIHVHFLIIIPNP